MIGEKTKVRGNGDVASYSKMIVRYKGNDFYINDLPRGIPLYLFNNTRSKLSRNAFAFTKQENIAERLGEEYRRNMWCADDKFEVIEKQDLEALLNARSLLRRILH